MDDLYLPPSNIPAEQSIIGSLLLDPLSAIKIDFLHSQDFFSEAHRIIYKAIADMATDRKPIDAITVAERINNQGQLDFVGGLEYITDLYRCAYSTATIVSTAHLVKDCAMRRNLLQAGTEICEIAAINDGTEVAEKQARALQLIQVIANDASGEGDARHISDVQRSCIERMQERLDRDNDSLLGISYGLAKIDAATDGMQKGKLITIAGRPGMGKSAFGIHAAVAAALNGAKVRYQSYEMEGEENVIRAQSAIAKLEADKIKNGRMNHDEYIRFTAAVSKLNDINIWFDDRPSIGVDRLSAMCRRQAMTSGIDLLVVDQLSLIPISRPSQNRAQELGVITRALKLLARELSIPVVLLHQLNRDNSKGVPRRPMLSDLKDSGSVEEDSDIVLLIHRPGYYDENANQGDAEIIIAKHRGGGLGIVPVGWLGKFTRFQDEPVFDQPAKVWAKDSYDDL